MLLSQLLLLQVLQLRLRVLQLRLPVLQPVQLLQVALPQAQHQQRQVRVQVQQQHYNE